MIVWGCIGCSHTKEKKKEFIFPSPSHAEEILAKGYLDISTFYTTTDYYIYKGITRGFHYDLARYFADYLGVKLRVKEVSFDIDSAFIKLDEGAYDLLAASITSTPEREKNVRLSIPIFTTREVLVQNKKNTPVHSLEELNGKTIYIKKGTPYRGTLTRIRDSLNIHINIIEDSLLSMDDFFYQVETGKMDYIVSDNNIAEILAESMSSLDHSLILKDEVSISWAMNITDYNFVDEVNNWIRKSKSNGLINILYARYFNFHPASSGISKYHVLKKGHISPYDALIKKSAKQLGWDWRLLAALIYTESKFNAEAESYVGAYGLMQILPETANMFNVTDYQTPVNNIRAGVLYLKYLGRFFDKYPIPEEEKIKFILAAYNTGAGHVADAMRLAEKYGKDPYRWTDHVDYYMLHKSEPKYYLDSLNRNGYSNGAQAYNYVQRVLDTYNNYRHMKF
ncbi:transporter substrate-binding domain-containing protein [Porphyromonadaceae bacterium OttesenSCG-928-L07]|nr:transporter substrate-binding domain-containing protein [Porphyromonadaceae bacterium OttesenSCG-928-L07]